MLNANYRTPIQGCRKLNRLFLSLFQFSLPFFIRPNVAHMEVLPRATRPLCPSQASLRHWLQCHG